MKNLSTLFKLQLLVVFVLSLATVNGFAQQSTVKSSYVSDKYKVTFQIPEGSTKQPESSEASVIFAPDESKFARGSGIHFAGNEEENVALVSQNLSNDEVFEGFVNGFIEGAKSDPDLKMSVTEKKRVQIGGFNSVRIAVNTSYASKPEIKIRLVVFAIPVPERKRMYVFTITGVEKDFDKWLPVAEASVNSFALIRAEPVKP